MNLLVYRQRVEQATLVGGVRGGGVVDFLSGGGHWL